MGVAASQQWGPALAPPTISCASADCASHIARLGVKMTTPPALRPEALVPGRLPAFSSIDRETPLEVRLQFSKLRCSMHAPGALPVKVWKRAPASTSACASGESTSARMPKPATEGLHQPARGVTARERDTEQGLGPERSEQRDLAPCRLTRARALIHLGWAAVRPFTIQLEGS